MPGLIWERFGKRLAGLTGAAWGIVTAGCCAALMHCTAAAISFGSCRRG